MKQIPWKKIALGATILSVLVILRAAVTVGRCLYFRGDWLAELREDTWMYIGLGALVIAVIAWIMAYGKTEDDPADALNGEVEQIEE